MSQSEYGQESFTAGWFIWLVRGVLVVVSAFTLWGAEQALAEFSFGDLRFGPPDAGLFWKMVGLCAASGAAFCLAVRVPFPRPRVAWGRVVFLLIGLVPAFHWYLMTYVRIPDAVNALAIPRWFDANPVIQVGAALGGVGLASAIGARRGKR